ncbi:MAG: SRPBCC domain-containing protein [Sulfolobaceae archaeon]
MPKKLSGKFNVTDINKVKNFVSNYSNFINCIPNVKDIKDKKFKIDAQVGAMKVTVDGELVDYKVTDNGYTSTIKIVGPGVITTVMVTSTIKGNEVSWESEYKLEGSMVPMLGSILENSVEAMINQTTECIKKKVL